MSKYKLYKNMQQTIKQPEIDINKKLTRRPTCIYAPVAYNMKPIEQLNLGSRQVICNMASLL